MEMFGAQIFVNMNIFAEDLCGKFERLCSQICENTDDSYVCKCQPGFQLQEDRVSCVSLKNDTTTTEGNEVLPTGSE